MKKTYVTPRTLEMQLKATTQLLGNSIEGFNKTLNDTGLDGEEALTRDKRRRKSLWDDDEDEDDLTW